MAWEPRLYRVSSQAENSQGLGTTSTFTLARHSGDLVLAGVAARCCSSLGITFGTGTFHPNQQNPSARHHLCELAPALGKPAPHAFSPSPQGQMTHRTARGLLPGERGHPSGSPGEGKQNVIFVTILHSNSKTFSSVLTSNLIWAILPVWHSQVALISPCGWGFLGGGGLLWGHSIWTLESFPVQTKW